jgi:magnesium chelatase subunit D
VDVTERVATILACCALDPRLAGLLFLDLDPALIYPLAGWLADLIGDTRVIPIGPKMAEETLWERFTLNRDPAERAEDLGFRWAPGPLAGYGRPAGIVTVPDLALVGLPAARAAVTLIGADVAHLERSGVSRTWHPRDRWLAALRRQDVGRVSPHLLDRFAVRVDAKGLGLPSDRGPILPEADPAWKRAVLAVQHGAELPALSAAAANQIMASVPHRVPGIRRDLALSRLARALAALAGGAEVLPGHVDSAAALAGLDAGPGRLGSGWDRPRHPADAESYNVPVGSDSARSEPDADPEGGPAAGRVAVGPEQLNAVNGHLAVVPGEATSLQPEPAGDFGAPLESAVPGPYPEDHAKPARDVAPLRIGWQRALTGPPRGQPIGTQRTLDKRDIAVAATLLNAARYQRLRCPLHYRAGHRLHVRPADLLSYRRAPRPGHLLVLVLDHTCRVRDWDWYEPLAPYLRWAYVTRALVGVVELGALADDVRSELRATQFRSRSVLDPRVADALRRLPGRATPLAHGLTLAAAMLRHDTQQAGVPVGEAFLVVVTDGRANVPLADSHTATLPVNVVGGIAVRDTEEAARAISALRRVRSVVIDPGPRPYGHLAALLAVALAAPLVRGTSPPGPASPEPYLPMFATGAT